MCCKSYYQSKHENHELHNQINPGFDLQKSCFALPKQEVIEFSQFLFLYFMMLVGGKINLSWNYCYTCTTKVHLTISDKWHFPTRLEKNILAIFLTQISQPVFLKKFILAESEDRKLQKVICQEIDDERVPFCQTFRIYERAPLGQYSD